MSLDLATLTCILLLRLQQAIPNCQSVPECRILAKEILDETIPESSIRNELIHRVNLQVASRYNLDLLKEYKEAVLYAIELYSRENAHAMLAARLELHSRGLSDVVSSHLPEDTKEDRAI